MVQFEGEKYANSRQKMGMQTIEVFKSQRNNEKRMLRKINIISFLYRIERVLAGAFQNPEHRRAKMTNIFVSHI